jgi:hypothetical protein
MRYIIFTILFPLAFLSCGESEKLIYYDKSDPAPTKIDNSTVSIENTAGKSVIRYSVPQDKNLLFIRAEYESAPGVFREVKSSRYTDTLAIEGFSAAGDYPVKLYSVGINTKESEPITVTVSPTDPPIVLAYPSLNMIAVFGGIRGSFRNDYQTPLKVVLMQDTTMSNNPEYLSTFVIDNPNAQFTVRNMPSTPAQYFAYLEDRWGNKSEMKVYTLTPLYEERLDKTKWKEFKLPSDFQNTLENNYVGYRFVGLFSDVICPWGGWSENFIPDNKSLPSMFTLDLGQTVKISRINLVPWWSWLYGNHVLEFEVYGSPSPAPRDDIFGSDWQLLGKFRSYKPSGDDPGIVTQDDTNYAWPGGENFDVEPTEEQPNPYFPLRTIRFRILKTWNDGYMYSIDELMLFGEVIN